MWPRSPISATAELLYDLSRQYRQITYTDTELSHHKNKRNSASAIPEQRTCIAYLEFFPPLLSCLVICCEIGYRSDVMITSLRRASSAKNKPMSTSTSTVMYISTMNVELYCIWSPIERRSVREISARSGLCIAVSARHMLKYYILSLDCSFHANTSDCNNARMYNLTWSELRHIADTFVCKFVYAPSNSRAVIPYNIGFVSGAMAYR